MWSVTFVTGADIREFSSSYHETCPRTAAELISPISLRGCIKNLRDSSLYFCPQKQLTGEVWNLPVHGGPHPLAYLSTGWGGAGGRLRQCF